MSGQVCTVRSMVAVSFYWGKVVEIAESTYELARFPCQGQSCVVILGAMLSSGRIYVKDHVPPIPCCVKRCNSCRSSGMVAFDQGHSSVGEIVWPQDQAGLGVISTILGCSWPCATGVLYR